MEQEYIDALVAHANTLEPRERLSLVNKVWACFRDHERLAYALAATLTVTEHDL
jgi:hypothetical protein